MTVVSIAEASRNLSRLINQAAYGRETVVLTSRGQAKAVLLGMDAFQELVGAHYVESEILPLDEFRQQFDQALVEARYDTREKIVHLVQEAKHEQTHERGL